MHNLPDNGLVKISIAPQALSGTSGSVAGTAIDCEGYEFLTAIASIGAVTNAAGESITVKLQESSGSAGTFTDITSATTPAVAYANQNKPYLISVVLQNRERFLRAVGTSGSATGGTFGTTFVLTAPRHNPPTQDNTVVKV